MIYIDGIGMKFLVNEIKNEILNYRVSKIYQYDKSSLSLFFGRQNLTFIINNKNTIFYLKDTKDDNTDFQSKFLLNLKKTLLNSKLINITQSGFDRIIYFQFEKLNQFGNLEKFDLIFEIMGKHSNLFLTEKNKIISSIFTASLDEGNRVIFPGSMYTPPFEKTKLSPMQLTSDDFPFTSGDDFLAAVEGSGKIFANEVYNNYNKFSEYLKNYLPVIYKQEKGRTLTYNVFSEFSAFEYDTYSTINESLNIYLNVSFKSSFFNSKKNNIIKFIDTHLVKNRKIIQNIKKDLDKNSNYQKYRNIGDILAANMHLLRHDIKEIALFDFYNEKEITIKLDPSLSPNENLNFYYNKYNKAKRTIENLNERLPKIEEEVDYLEEIKVFVNNETDIIGLEELENELNIKQKRKIKLNKKIKREILSYQFEDFTILVGRNSRENEEISFTKGNSNDIWLHIKDLPGSHVLILRENREVPDSVLLYAANLAGLYSKSGIGDKVTIDYCEKRFVKKIKKSKPGNVTYINYKSTDVVIKNIQT
ncbi:NFACT family protein [Sebaldella sp. S0638]|uniref:Rqc2 family fibronectin-binding protein n=1 Tax=Sebaldella sp. S0638 TaxID=2957809 RepID=UPI0020A13732|nr:NFACT family protein [Sebaldella sp. S0638]MCP1222838.1 NFACT family protein [Sebaldella sp. S0638]